VLLDNRLAFRIKRTCGFVKDQNWRVMDKRARDRQPLTLATGSIGRTLFQYRRIAMREALDEFVCARNLSHPNDLFQGGRWFCDGDVFPNCSAEHKIFLEDNPDPRPEMSEIKFF